MKKMICTRLLRLSATTLACTMLLAGTYSYTSEGIKIVDTPAAEAQDGNLDPDDEDTKDIGELIPNNPGIQPLEDWESKTAKS